MKVSHGVIFIFMLVLCACESFPENSFELYSIRKGEHFSNRRHVELLQYTTLSFEAKFDESAEYIIEKGFQDSKNKLLGFSDCNSSHHENSARFAWQWLNNRIEIFAYCYVNGQRVESFLGTVEKGEVAQYEIRISDSSYTFIFKDQKTEIERKNACNTGAYFILWPYFGGQIPAPHDVNIYLRRF
jgi:hypothetical protein